MFTSKVGHFTFEACAWPSKAPSQGGAGEASGSRLVARTLEVEASTSEVEGFTRPARRSTWQVHDFTSEVEVSAPGIWAARAVVRGSCHRFGCGNR